MRQKNDITNTQNAENQHVTQVSSINLINTGTMKKHTETVKMLLEILEGYVGATPTLQIDYKNEEVYLLDASCGLIKELLDAGAVTHLQDGKLSVSFFR